MPRKLKEAERAKPALESALKSAREVNGCDRLLTTKDAANFLRLSTSWLAKARMRGDGPPYVKLGGSIRYLESTLVR
jgi:predicted DNA-binding transcriptional regulator AlpA